VVRCRRPCRAPIIAAALVYLVGCFGVTVVFNVPMNEALAGMTSPSEATQRYWFETYVPRWTFWNSVRTGASAISAMLLLVGLLWMAQSPDLTARRIGATCRVFRIVNRPRSVRPAFAKEVGR
jgi:hypothetical protein